ncbi:MAG: phosphohistidine phosphatase SixA [Synechocystis sp.]
MELYLIRHGIAEDRREELADGDRRLTAKGIDKTQRIAQRLQKMGVEFDLILSSPLTRAQQTAQLFIERGLSPQLETFAPLTPATDIARGLEQLAQDYASRSKRCLALVGHQPDLSQWAEYLVFGAPHDKIVLKKAGIIGVSLPVLTHQPGQGQLFLVTAPRWLL